ncbi:caspase family protein [Spirulina sp. 06S082]|uniref:caspase family protein n=1 Tax=Spirulina sp. 06S082 TaxID=3110248 RepID=UPI002B1F3525|nr:caspase family protein [Spirulina sp. 06S082]MEA5469769.1 caspase family protein [Spirulina sp. 06S082]
MANHALIIGINEYQRLPSLRFALRDAALMRDFLADELGFEEVFYFTDDSPAIDAPDGSLQETQPTYSNLISFLHDFFEYSQLETGDNFWFFFSGHGIRENGQDYLMPCTGNPRLVGQTAIAISYIAERLRRSGADNVILFLDACRNENDLGDRSGAIALEQHQGTISISACSPYERSFEIEAIAQGSFTYALLESLRIRGADNCATVERLYNRLRYRVTELNQQYEKPRQVPYAVVEPAQKLHYILLPQQATEQDILLLVSEAQEAEIEGDDELAEQLWVRVLAASPANSKALRALKRIWRKGSPPTPKSGGVRNPTPKSGGVRNPTPKSGGVRNPTPKSGGVRNPTPKSGGEGTSTLTQIWGNNSESSPPNPQIWGSKKTQVEDGKSPEIGGFRGQSKENESPTKLSLPSFSVEDGKSPEIGGFRGQSKENESPTKLSLSSFSVEDGKSPEIGGFRGQSQENESPSKLSLPSFDFEVVTVNAKGKIVKKERRSANYLREDLGNGVAIDMVSIPGGSFLMGSPEGQGYNDEHPQHKVTVKPFLMGKTPITQAQWREVVTQVETIERELNPDPSYFKGDKRPVERVSWYDALEFCVRLSRAC